MIRSLLLHLLVIGLMALGLLARTLESSGDQLALARHVAARRLPAGDLEQPSASVELARALPRR